MEKWERDLVASLTSHKIWNSNFHMSYSSSSWDWRYASHVSWLHSSQTGQETVEVLGSACLHVLYVRQPQSLNLSGRINCLGLRYKRHVSLEKWISLERRIDSLPLFSVHINSWYVTLSLYSSFIHNIILSLF